ncbi:MAG: GIY-YIG nuclease family protein [bacterium]|nr:GIY-YIG nuclease family protein [bacterium]
MWYVYIIKSQLKKWYYVGSTNRLDIRLKEHNNGQVTSTKLYLPFNMVYKKKFDSEMLAREYERLIKDKRILKESLIKDIESS